MSVPTMTKNSPWLDSSKTQFFCVWNLVVSEIWMGKMGLPNFLCSSFYKNNYKKPPTWFSCSENVFYFKNGVLLVVEVSQKTWHWSKVINCKGATHLAQGTERLSWQNLTETRKFIRKFMHGKCCIYLQRWMTWKIWCANFWIVWIVIKTIKSIKDHNGV